MLQKININILIAIFALAAFFIWHSFITYPELSHDEPFSVYHAHIPIGDLLNRLASGNNPPLYEICLHYWILIFGNKLVTLRLMSELFMCSALVINAKTVYRDFGFKPMLITCTLFLFSNFYLNFAHEARGYALFLFLTILFSNTFLSILSSSKSHHSIKEFLKTNWLQSLLFVFYTSQLLYSHYMSMFVVLSATLFLCVQAIQKSISTNTILVFFILGCCVLLLYLPQLYLFVSNLLKVATGGTWLGSPEIADLYNLLWKFNNSPLATVLILAPLLFIPAYLRFKSTIEYKWMVYMFWLPFIGVFILSQKIPLFHDRYMIFISPFVYNLIAVNIGFILEKYSSKLKYLSILPIVVFIFSFQIRGKESDNLQGALSSSNQESTMYVVSPNWYNYNFYYYFNHGKYFYSFFDINHNEPKNVIFDYNLSSFNYKVIADYKVVNIISTGDPNQNYYNHFNAELLALGYQLHKVITISKVSKSYLYKK